MIVMKNKKLVKDAPSEIILCGLHMYSLNFSKAQRKEDVRLAFSNKLNFYGKDIATRFHFYIYNSISVFFRAMKSSGGY